MATGELRRLCGTDEVPAGGARRADLDGESYAVFNLAGRFFVTANFCTHGPGELAEGYVLDDEVECPFHQGRFHIATGRPSEPPCTVPIRVWTAHVRDDAVFIDPRESR